MDKTMKKFLIALLAAVCLACVAFAAACTDKEPEYFLLTFEKTEGVEYVCEIPSGYEVKEGTEVSFGLEVSDKVVGEPTVRVNGEQLEPEADGGYKFIMNGESKVSVSDVYYIHSYRITFDKGDNRITYRNTEGDVLETLNVEEGERVEFKIDVSVYHDREADFSVLANSVELKPSNGVYSFTATGNTRIGVYGLDIAQGFTERPNTGNGTKEYPYLISEPVDLYYMRQLINTDYHSGAYSVAHYKLMADLDLEGEQLYVLGDATYSGQLNQLSYFSGSFDGNGHTISNYFMSDTQEDNEKNPVEIAYIGLFGYVDCDVSGAVEIKNLHLKNFTINVDGANIANSAFFAGGIVGYGAGVNITGCTVEGKITANGPSENYFGFVGGVAGYLTSKYISKDVKFNSSIVSTGSKVEISGHSGWMRAAGGLVGSLDASDNEATSYILNSYAQETVSGAIRTGGLVGELGSYTAIENSYFTGRYASASSRIENSPVFETYSHAYGGGIVGYAGGDSVISGCFTSGSATASAYAGNSFAHSGNIYGGCEAAGANLIETYACAVRNSHYNSNSSTLNENYAKNTLGWLESDWNFSNALPTPSSVLSGEFTVTIDFKGTVVNGGDTATVELSGNLYNMAQLYSSGKIEAFTENGNLRTFGYFFDSELEEKVPFAYVPAGNVTLYTDFANYNEVAGRYYLEGENGAYLDLNSDGSLYYRDGALSHTSYYTYDGKQITLIQNAAFLVVTRLQITEEVYYDIPQYFCAIAEYNAGKITVRNISDGYSNANTVMESSHYYDKANPLTGVKELENFVYGNYYDESGNLYAFNPDGTGIYRTQSFKYTVDGLTVKTDIGGALGTGVIEADGTVKSLGTVNLSKIDPFAGVWENSATSHKQYTFDGKGGYAYEYTLFNTEGSEIAEVSGTYTVEDGVLTLDGGNITASFDENGFITVNNGEYDETFYVQNSFVGDWKYFNIKEAMEIVLYGINKDGYGKGLITYGTGSYTSEFEYEAVSVTEGDNTYADLYLFTEDTLIGSLRYSSSDNTLFGNMFSHYYNIMRAGALFCLYDDFTGVWTSDEFGIIEFNGLGGYDIPSGPTVTIEGVPDNLSSIMRVVGEVTVNGEYVGRYTVDGFDRRASFVYGGKTYVMTFDVQTGLINITENGRSFNLTRLDSHYGITYVDENGDNYVLSGGGYSDDGGKIYKNDTEVYSYKIASDGSIGIYALGGGEKIGELTVKDDVYSLEVGASPVKLTYANPFTGEWVVGGAQEGTLTIGKIGVGKTASGTYFGNAVTFTYNLEGNFLTFTSESGTLLYVYSFTGSGNTELSVGESETDGNSLICIKAERVSELKGNYVNGDEQRIYLDGMNSSTFGKGTAVIYEENGFAQYSYKLDNEKILLSRIIQNGEEKTVQTLVLRRVPTITAGNNVYVKDDNSCAYELLVPDSLFNTRVWNGNRTVIYRFDGLGTVTATAGESVTTYTYEIVSYNDVTRTYELTLTDEEGGEYKAVCELSGNSVIRLEKVEKDKE